MQLICVVYVLKLCQCVKGRVNFKFGLQKKKNNKIWSCHSSCVMCVFGQVCSNWLCQTEELDEAQTNCGLFI